MGGYSVLDFSNFIEKLEEHSNLLNEEGTENDTWRKILGTEFPTDSAAKTNALAEAVSVSYCLKATHRAAPLWPIQKGQVAFISASILSPQGERIEYQNNGRPLPKHCSLQFTAVTPVKPPYIVKWQVVNTGSEAQNIPGGLRGGFEDSNIGRNVRTEKTEYKGKHFIQCLIIKRGVCVARSKEYIINIM
ncbi:hypothetical protein LJB83_02145 [Clostridia bacterium OttesenSCG-928-F22]|nr:hypothetical protein [Clostridia bacterium OttesenSCG-928-F22]